MVIKTAVAAQRRNSNQRVSKHDVSVSDVLLELTGIQPVTVGQPTPKNTSKVCCKTTTHTFS